jgi:UDP-glucose 4-epimerase
VATLITGGTGLIGETLAGRLLSRGDDVVLLDILPNQARIDRLEAGGPPGRLIVVRGDVTALAELQALVARHDVDAIVHLASLLGPESDANPGRAVRVNCEGTTNVLDAVRLAGLRRIVLASSIAVYGPNTAYPTEDLPLSEDAALWGAPGMRMYAAAKMYGEQLAHHYLDRFGVSVAALRPSIVHGPGRRGGATDVVTALIEDSARGRPVSIGLGDAEMSLVSVEEVADQFLALLDTHHDSLAERHVYNSGGFTTTVRGLADLVRELDPTADITVASSVERDVGGLATRVSGEALLSTIGYVPRFDSLAAAIREQMETARARSTGAYPTVEAGTAS